MIKLEIYRQSNPHMPNIQGVLIHAKNEEGVEIKKNPIHPLHTSTTQALYSVYENTCNPK